MSPKNPVTPPGIDPGTVRLVTQRIIIGRDQLSNREGGGMVFCATDYKFCTDMYGGCAPDFARRG
jgi:hypothetical protein